MTDKIKPIKPTYKAIHKELGKPAVATSVEEKVEMILDKVEERNYLLGKLWHRNLLILVKIFMKLLTSIPLHESQQIFSFSQNKRNFWNSLNLELELKQLEELKKLKEENESFIVNKDEPDLDEIIKQKKREVLVFTIYSLILINSF